MTSWGGLRARRLLAVAVSLALLGSLTGCAGRMSKARYQEEVGKLSVERKGVVTELPSHDSSDVRWFANAQETTHRGASDLDRLQPPKEVEGAHDKHVEATRGLSRLLGKLADCARLQQRDAAAGRACRAGVDQLELDEVRNDFQEADVIYEEHGYTFDG